MGDVERCAERAVNAVWSEIGEDALVAFGGRMGARAIREIVLDAGRPEEMLRRMGRPDVAEAALRDRSILRAAAERAFPVGTVYFS